MLAWLKLCISHSEKCSPSKLPGLKRGRFFLFASLPKTPEELAGPASTQGHLAPFSGLWLAWASCSKTCLSLEVFATKNTHRAKLCVSTSMLWSHN